MRTWCAKMHSNTCKHWRISKTNRNKTSLV
jgi:hypothetical protein